MLGCTHGAWSALPVLSPFKLVLFLSTFLSMQVCVVAKRLFDEAQREPDKKKSRALNKQAQQWLDDYCLHSADMVGAVQSTQRHSRCFAWPSVPILSTQATLSG